jgi:hypothetical protein
VGALNSMQQPANMATKKEAKQSNEDRSSRVIGEVRSKND